MNKQEILDKVVPLILKNGFSYQKGTCRYRKNNSPTDRVRCAVGYLIPDEMYHPEIEGKRSTSYEIRDLLIKAGFEIIADGPNNDMDFLEDLQYAHDKPPRALHKDLNDFLFYIKEICQSYNLTYRPEWKI